MLACFSSLSYGVRSGFDLFETLFKLFLSPVPRGVRGRVLFCHFVKDIDDFGPISARIRGGGNVF